MSREPFVVEETWDGDGKPGACFILPNGLTVFVSGLDNTRHAMSKEEFEMACQIRDMLRSGKPSAYETFIGGGCKEHGI